MVRKEATKKASEEMKVSEAADHFEAEAARMKAEMESDKKVAREAKKEQY